MRAYGYLLIVVLIWGIAPSVIKFGLGELPPFLFLTYRFLITTLILVPFLFTAKEKSLPIGKLPLVIVASLLGSTVNLGLLFYGTNLTTSLDASLITATAPIFVALAGIWFLHEHVTKIEKIGIAITFAGTVIIAFQSFFEGRGDPSHSVLGNSIIFASNIAFAIYLLLSKEALKKGVSAFAITFMMFFIGFITTLPIAIRESPNQNLVQMIFKLSLSAQLSVAFMAVLSGAIAYFLYQKAQKSIEASEAAVFTYLTPLVTAPVGVLWLHEKISTIYVLGSIIISVGVFLAEWKKKRYN